MNQTLLQHVGNQSARKVTPEIRAGMTVRVSQKIKEGDKERTQDFEGLVIAVNGGKGISGTFTVRKIVGGIGVEKVLPLHGKTITKINVIKQANVRKSKLYYMRGLRGKAARMQEEHVQKIIHEETIEKVAKDSKDAKVAKDTEDGEAGAKDEKEETKKEEKPAKKEEAKKE
ncbi:MAG: 50S ribosomal protein L19 [Patescibacteria group bacterium]